MRRRGRKLLVASLGVAAVSYVACGSSDSKEPDPPTADASTDAARDADARDATMDILVANLIAPPIDATTDDDAADTGPLDATLLDVVANLIPPPPPPDD